MRLSELQDKHSEEIIFIVGSGPSINNIDMDLLKDYTVMAVNSGLLTVPFASYFISDDIGIINWSYFSNLKEMNCICLFFESKWKDVDINNIDANRVVFYNHKTWFSPPSTYNLPDGLVLTKDINKPIIGSRTSLSSCVHLAYCMGAKTVVLIGNDCQLSKDKYKYRYFWQYWPKEKRPYRIKGTHFNKNTQNIGFDQKAFVEYWNNFVEVNKNILRTDLEIIDCSDSILDCFPKMALQEIIKNKQGEKMKLTNI
jgi:hypothetical protein